VARIPESRRNPYPLRAAALTGSRLSILGVVRDGNIAFQVDFRYSAIEDYNTANGHNGTPKLELESTAYAAPLGSGEPVDPSTWLYSEILNGTLTGLTTPRRGA
jgi:hypothetical protein